MVEKRAYDRMIQSTIMMVDDEPLTLEMVKAHLVDANYSKFVLIEDSSLALHKIEESSPDILLLDLSMPKVSGFDVLSEVRAHPEFKHLPIIVLTASSDKENKVKALGLGANDFLAKPVDPVELCLRVYNTLAAKAYQDELAFYDPLTGLPNREMFFKDFDRLLDKAKENESQLAIMNIELDKFDTLNDTIGIKFGDELLRMTATRIINILQNPTGLFDSNISTSLYHIDGASFALLAEPLESFEYAADLANIILEEIRGPIPVSTLETSLTSSIGIAVYPSCNDNRLKLWRHASSAKNFVKKNNGDNYRFFSSEISALNVKSFDLATKLRKAVENGELRLYYQPIVDCRTDKLKGMEALLRWQKNEELLLPEEFIPLADDTGVINHIGDWTLEKACFDLLNWQQTGIKLDNISIKLNITPNQFTEEKFLPHITRIIEKTGVDTKLLTFEVSEWLLHKDIEQKIILLNKLKRMGIRLSIDDFGMGYSSLGILSRLPVNELKISRSFIEKLTTSNYNRAVIASILYLARNLGLKTIAVGVETEEQLQYLQSQNCDNYQGFLFQEAVPGNKIKELLKIPFKTA